MIQVQVKTGSRDRLEIYVDGELWREVHRSIFGRRPRFTQEIATLSQLEELFASLEYAGAKRYVLWRLARSSQSSMALLKSLQERCVSQTVQQNILTYLTKSGFIDDQDYVQRLIAGEKARGRGPAAIRAKLRKKGIPSSMAKAGLDGLNEEDQQLILQRLIQTRYSRRNLEDPKDRQKVIAALVRRGFSYDMIKLIINH